MNRNIKHCPYCGEEIKTEAKKCRHCNEWLTEEGKTTSNREGVSAKDSEGDSPLMNVAGCLLAIIDVFWLPIVLLVCAAIFVPNEKAHNEEIHADVIECIKDESGEWMDILGGSELKGLASIFMETGEVKEGIIDNFDHLNKIQVNKSWFWSTGKLINRLHPEGTTVSFGIFGMVFPFVDWDDIVLVDKQK